MRSGRSAGKSHGVAQVLLLMGKQRKLKVLCTRAVQIALDESWHPMLVKLIDIMQMHDFYEIQKNRIKGKNGTVFLFSGLHAGARKLRSFVDIDILVVDEAQDVSEDAFVSTIPTVREEGTKIIYLYNPENEDDPIHQRAERAKLRPDSIVIDMHWSDNEHNSQTILDEIANDKKFMDPAEYAHVWDGALKVVSDAQIYKRWQKVMDTSDTEPGGKMLVWDKGEQYEVEIPANAKRIMGADWGWKHPTALVSALYWERNLYITHEAVRTEVSNEYVPALFAGDDTIVPENPRWENPQGWPGVPHAMTCEIIADHNAPEKIRIMREYGFTMKAAKKAANSVVDGISFLQSHKIWVHANCLSSIYELGNYCYKTDPKTKEVKKDEICKEHDHCMDSLRYSTEPLRTAAAIAGGGNPIDAPMGEHIG